MSAADFSQLTAIISTANQPKSLSRLVQSVQKRLPEIKILVADHGNTSNVPKQVTAVKVPTGVGRASGYNALLARIRTPYFLLLDECLELTPETQIENLLKLVADDDLDLAGGDLVGARRKLWFFVKRQPQPGHALLEFDGEQLTVQPGHRTVSTGFAWCDMVHNFYVARTSKVRNLGGWDPELENNEREEFFVRAQRQGLRVGLAPEVVATLWQEPTDSESTPVDRRSLAVAKMGLTRMVDAEGHTIKAPRRAAASEAA